MKEEDNILRKIGTENHFSVPEDYFQRLTTEVMERLPERERKAPVKEITTWQRIKPWAYMAAMFAGAALIIRLASGSGEKVLPLSESDTETLTDEYLDTAMDHSMLDDYSLYLYLSEGSTTEETN